MNFGLTRVGLRGRRSAKAAAAAAEAERKAQEEEDEEEEAKRAEAERKAQEDDEDDDEQAKRKAQEEEEEEEDEEDEDEDEAKASGKSSAKASARAAKDATKAERARAREINDLCVLAEKPELAGRFIAEGVAVKDVRRALLAGKASASKAGAIAGQRGPERSPAADAALWDHAVARNARAAGLPEKRARH